MHSVYVYYRIDPAQVELAAKRIDALLQDVAAHCGAPPRRLNRCNDKATWMEVYENVLDFEGFLAALNVAVDSRQCAAFTLGERHLECFTHSDAHRLNGT